MWLWVIVLVGVIGAVAVLAAGRDDAMVEAYDDRPDATLPTGRPLTADDLDAVRFSTAMRGYRMDEVDALVARVQADLLARETEAELLAADERRAADELRAADDPTEPLASESAREPVTVEVFEGGDEPGRPDAGGFDKRDPQAGPSGASALTQRP